MPLELAAIIAPVYLIVAVGFLWGRLGRRFDTEGMSDLIMSVGAPCLVFSSLTSIGIDLGEVVRMVAATLLALASFAALGAAILRLAGIPLQTFLAPLVFMNAGNMGLPLCLFAFGEEGLAFAVAFYTTCAIAHFTFGLWIWEARVSLGVFWRSPLAIAAIASVAVLASGWTVPTWIANTTGLIGDFTIPLLQLSLGVSLGRFPLERVGRSLSLSFVRLGMGLAVGLALAALLGLEGVARSVFVLDCSMPVAVFNYMMAERYGRSPSEIASLVMISTLLSFAALPAILAWLL